MEPPLSNRLANINDLRGLAKRLNMRLPAILSSKQFKADNAQDMDKPFVELTTNDQQLTDHEYEQPRPSTQQAYGQLWQQISAISNSDLLEESKGIMELTRPVQNRLQVDYYSSKAEQERLQHSLQEFYVNSHRLYEKLKGLRGQQSRVDIKRKIMLKELKDRHKNLLSSELYGLLPDQQEYKELLANIDVLKKEIEEINSRTAETSKHLHLVKKETKKSYICLVRFLREALKHGLDYRESGICWIIKSLQELGVEASATDLPSCLDEHSKRYLLTRAKRMRQHPSNLASLTSQRSIEGFQSVRPIRNPGPTTLPLITNTGSTQRTITTKSLSFIGVSEAPGQDGLQHQERKMKKVYINTKRCIDEIIKDRQTSLNTKVQQYTASRSVQKLPASQQDRMFSQYQRIVAGYPRSTYQLALKMVFGWDRSFVR